MIVALEESRDGGLMARVDGFICFFDRSADASVRGLGAGTEIDVMFAGINRRKTVLFMTPVRRDLGHRLIRHEGFRPMGRGWEIMAYTRCPRGRVILGHIPLPVADGSGGRTHVEGGFCWVKPVKHAEASFHCVGVENPWNFLGIPKGLY